MFFFSIFVAPISTGKPIVANLSPQQGTISYNTRDFVTVLGKNVDSKYWYVGINGRYGLMLEAHMKEDRILIKKDALIKVAIPPLPTEKATEATVSPVKINEAETKTVPQSEPSSSTVAPPPPLPTSNVKAAVEEPLAVKKTAYTTTDEPTIDLELIAPFTNATVDHANETKNERQTENVVPIAQVEQNLPADVLPTSAAPPSTNQTEDPQQNVKNENVPKVSNVPAADQQRYETNQTVSNSVDKIPSTASAPPIAPPSVVALDNGVAPANGLPPPKTTALPHLSPAAAKEEVKNEAVHAPAASPNNSDVLPPTAAPSNNQTKDPQQNVENKNVPDVSNISIGPEKIPSTASTPPLASPSVVTKVEEVKTDAAAPPAASPNISDSGIASTNNLPPPESTASPLIPPSVAKEEVKTEAVPASPAATPNISAPTNNLPPAQTTQHSSNTIIDKPVETKILTENVDPETNTKTAEAHHIDPYTNLKNILHEDLPPPPPIDTIEFKSSVPLNEHHSHNDHHHHHHHAPPNNQFYTMPTQKPLVQNNQPPQLLPVEVPSLSNEVPSINQSHEQFFVDETNSVEITSVEDNSAELPSTESIEASTEHVGSVEEVAPITTPDIIDETNASQDVDVEPASPGIFSGLWSSIGNLFGSNSVAEEYDEFKKSIDQMLFASPPAEEKSKSLGKRRVLSLFLYRCLL